MALDVEIDRDRCMGSGHCVFGAPGAFDLDDDQVAFVVDPAGAPEEDIVLAAQRCPTKAITVHRDGEQLV